MKHKLNFIAGGGGVKRFHVMPTLHSQNVAEHSFGVAWIVWLLTGGNPSARLLMAAIAHDLAEHVTGDLPAPAKRSLGISEQFAAYEDRIMEDAGFSLPELTEFEKKLLKLADTADLLLFCIREIALGNRQMHVVYQRGMAYTEELHPLGPVMQELINAIEEKYREECQ